MSYIKKNKGTSFERFVASTMHTVPFLAITVIATNYIIMGWATSALLAGLLAGVPTGVYIAWAVGIIASLGRGSLVFLPNFDPDKPDFTRRGEIVAAVFTLAFLYEITHLVATNGIDPVVGVSLGILALMGCVLEILAVGNIKRKHNADIASDPDRLRKYVNTSAAIANMEALEDEVRAAMAEDGQFFDLSKFDVYFKKGGVYDVSPSWGRYDGNSNKSDAGPLAPPEWEEPEGEDWLLKQMNGNGKH